MLPSRAQSKTTLCTLCKGTAEEDEGTGARLDCPQICSVIYGECEHDQWDKITRETLHWSFFFFKKNKSVKNLQHAESAVLFSFFPNTGSSTGEHFNTSHSASKPEFLRDVSAYSALCLYMTVWACLNVSIILVCFVWSLCLCARQN